MDDWEGGIQYTLLEGEEGEEEDDVGGQRRVEGCCQLDEEEGQWAQEQCGVCGQNIVETEHRAEEEEEEEEEVDEEVEEDEDMSLQDDGSLEKRV